MTKHKDREFGQELFESLKRISRRSAQNPNTPAEDLSRFVESGSQRASELRKMKKFRFQLLHRWLVEHFEPCRAADIGGGKGLLTHLMQTSGWEATVIDPVHQPLPDKYKDLTTGKRVRIAPTEEVRHINKAFEVEMAQHFDMLVGMHAHGSNAKIIEAASEYSCGFVLFPCCVIDEPFYPPIGVHWLESLTDYAASKGHSVYPFRLNFRGQNLGLCATGRCKTKQVLP